jgi:hypothetical protein
MSFLLCKKNKKSSLKLNHEKFELKKYINRLNIDNIIENIFLINNILKVNRRRRKNI